MMSLSLKLFDEGSDVGDEDVSGIVVFEKPIELGCLCRLKSDDCVRQMAEVSEDGFNFGDRGKVCLE